MAPPPGKRGSGKPRADKSNAGGSRPGKPGGGKPKGGRPSASKRPIAAGGPPKRRPRPAVAGSKPSAGSAGREQRGERLQKVLAAAGLASRRECEEYITEGRVQVDGEVVTELGARVDRAKQEIKVDGEPLPRIRLQYFAVHKPPGIVSTARDPSGRPRVIDLLPPGVGRMFNVGRLDMASEGLILVTNDGPLADKLTHPRHGVEKIYEVTVAGQPDADVLAQVKRGVHLSEGFVHAVDVRVKSTKKGATVLEMVLDEGRNREIRRLLARLGHKVQRLIRVAVGPIRLGELPRGAVRMLTPEEVKKLREAAAAGPRDDADDATAHRRPGRGPGGPKRPSMRGSRPAIGKGPGKKRPPIGAAGPVRSVIGDDVPAAHPPAAPPAAPGGKPPRKAFGGKKPGRPGAFKKKVGHQKGQGGRGKPKPGGKR